MTDLRDATAADLDQVGALESALFGRTAWSPAMLRAELAAAGDTRDFLVAEGPGGLCGYGVLLTVADRADLQRIAVAPDHRRAGIGSRLLAELVTRCRAGGGSALLLEVAADNGPASAFYRRHGFVEVARRPRYYADGREAVVMRLDLEPGRVLG